MHLRTRALVAFASSALLWSFAACGQAQSKSQEYDFDIPRLPLTKALSEFASQANLQLLYLPQSDEEEQIPMGPIAGRFTVDAILTKTLPSGFTFQWSNERTVVILPPIIVTPPSLPESSGLTLVHSEAGAGILVVASRIWMDALLQSPTAVLELDRRKIEAFGASTLPELLRYLTQQPFARSDLSNLGDQRVELRGLGRDTTLVLINGRRVGASSASFDIDAFNLHMIPLTAVERIEVIQDFLPFTIGADAIAGMVNIVLRSDFRESLLEVNYGTAEGGAEERRASVSGGKVIGGVRLSAVLEHFELDGLLGNARDRWRNQDYRRFGSVDYRSLASNPGNVRSLSLDNLPGLPSRFAAVPPHDHDQRLAAEDFLATAGQQNFESLRRYRSIVPERERTSLVASGEANASPTTLLFGEIFYTRSTTIVRDLPVALSNVVVPATNVFNPFGTAVGASFLPSSVGARIWNAEVDFIRALAGLQGQWNRWTWDLSLQHTRDTSHVSQENELDPMRLADALAQSDPDRALNVFDDGPGGSAELIESLIAAPLVRDYLSKSTQATARARGELWELPAGSLSLTWGAEWRESMMSIDARLPQSPTRALTAGSVEVRVPVVDPSMSFTGIHRLVFAGAGRIDDYSDMGRVSSWQFGLTWEPVWPLSVRAAVGTHYRPPSIFEMYLPVVQLPFALPDVRRSNQTANVIVTVGGNPDLQVTTARSWSAGFSFEPESANHLSLAATYWSSRLEDRVTPIALPVLLAHDELFPGRIVRAPPTAADTAAGLPGRLLALDVTPDNIGTLTATGIDLSAAMDFETRLGRFRPTVSISWMDQFSVIDAPGLAAVDRVGLASLLGTIPQWRAVAGVAWNRDALSATTTARFVSAYDDFNSVLNRNNGRTVRSQAFLDVQASLQLDSYLDPKSTWRGLRISAGIANLFNKQPPFAELGADLGYDFTQGDLKGRFSYLRLAKRF